MRFKDQLDFVMQHIKKNKLRVFMTVLAATMGCAFLIVLASVGFGLQASIEKDILSNDSVTKIEVQSSQSQFTEEEVAEIQAVEHVQTVLKITNMNAEAQSFFEDRDTIGSVSLTNFNDLQQVADDLSTGVYPTNANEILVGYHFAQTLLNDADRKRIEEKSLEAQANGDYYDGSEEGYKESLLGKEIEVAFRSYEDVSKQTERQKFKIVGVLAKPSYEWAIDNKMYLSDAVAPKLEESFGQAFPEQQEALYFDRFEIYATSLEYVKPILEELRDKGFGVYSVTEQLEELNVFFLVLKAGLIFVGTIAVLIASIGIFNTMTMAVTERTREIGVLKAIGASPKLIQRLFLMESMFIGVIGTVIAVAISYAVSFASNALLPVVLKAATGEESFDGIQFSAIPWQLVVIAAAISIGVAIISGVRPARKATKIEVMQALRQEA